MFTGKDIEKIKEILGPEEWTREMLEPLRAFIAESSASSFHYTPNALYRYIFFMERSYFKELNRLSTAKEKSAEEVRSVIKEGLYADTIEHFLSFYDDEYLAHQEIMAEVVVELYKLISKSQHTYPIIYLFENFRMYMSNEVYLSILRMFLNNPHNAEDLKSEEKTRAYLLEPQDNRKYIYLNVLKYLFNNNEEIEDAHYYVIEELKLSVDLLPEGHPRHAEALNFSIKSYYLQLSLESSIELKELIELIENNFEPAEYLYPQALEEHLAAAG